MEEYNLRKNQRRGNLVNRKKDVKKSAPGNSLKALYEDTVKTLLCILIL